MDFLRHLTNPHTLAAGGYVVMFLIIYAETGLMVGFFFPGDSLLVTAGVFAATPNSPLNIAILIPLLCVAAIAGDNTGYWFGRKVGPSLFSRPNSRLFKREHLMKAQAFYDKHGPKMVILARFVPIVRTFGPIVAGIGQMPYRRYVMFSIMGGVAWITSMSLLGYFLGRSFPNIDKNIDKVVIVIVAVSILPIVIHWLQERKAATQGSMTKDVPSVDAKLDAKRQAR